VYRLVEQHFGMEGIAGRKSKHTRKHTRTPKKYTTHSKRAAGQTESVVLDAAASIVL
jgi:hypothetical protein